MGKRQLTPRHQAYLLDYDDGFLVPGHRVDSSWHLCAAAATVAQLAFVGLLISCKAPLPGPGDAKYQLVRESSKV